MPRGPRSDAPGVLHHITLRGIERRRIFFDVVDKQDFVDRLAEIFPAAGLRCLAWSLIPNHVHMIVQTGPVPLFRVMSRLNTGYAVRFNLRHERSGFLFQNRYGTRAIRDEAHLKTAICYADGNPWKHGLVPNLDALEAFPWCGYGALIGRRPALPFESVEDVLALFDERLETSVPALRRWMADWGGTHREGADDASNAALATVAAEPHEALRANERRTPEPLLMRVDPDQIISRICSRMGCDPIELDARGRLSEVSRARSAIVWVLRSQLGLSNRDVGERLGMADGSVSRCLRRGRAVAREEGLEALVEAALRDQRG